MVAQVSGPTAGVYVKDPRRKAQNIRFKHSSNIPYMSTYDADNQASKPQQNTALYTSVLVVLGAVLFMAGYFLITGLKKKV